MNDRDIEIERKFRVMHWGPGALEFLRNAERKIIEQGYFDANPATRVRITRHNGNVISTFEQKVKRPTEFLHPEQEPLIHDQLEVPLDVKTGAELYGLTAHKLSKMRFSWDDGDIHYDLDIFMGKLRGLEILEVELPTEDRALELPPNIHLKEVTNDSRYSNKELAKLNGAHELSKYDEAPHTPTKFENIEDGVAHCIGKINDALKRNPNNVVVVGIVRPNRDEVSAVAEKIAEFYGNDALLINMEDYFKGTAFVHKNSPQGGSGGLNPGSPLAFDLPQLSRDLDNLKNEMSIKNPAFPIDPDQREGHDEIIEPRKIIIVDGMYTLYPEIAKILDYSVFAGIDLHGPLWRRIICDVVHAGRSKEEIFAEIAIIASPLYFTHIELQKDFSDIWILEEALPAKEKHEKQFGDTQVRSRNTSKANIKRALESIGFDLDQILNREDEYYYLDSWPTISMNNTIRVKVESVAGEKAVIALEHNGPKPDNCPHPDSCNIFEVDSKVVKILPALGYESLGKIRRQREVYKHPEYTFVVSLDYFIHGDQVLPPVVEVSARSESELKDAIRLLRKHGLHNSVFVDATYAEIFFSAPK